MTTLIRCCCLVIIGCAVLWTAGCNHDKSKPYELGDVPDTRIPIHLPAEADRAHREVMMQHLETVQVLTGALADGGAATGLAVRFVSPGRNSTLPTRASFEASISLSSPA